MKTFNLIFSALFFLTLSNVKAQWNIFTPGYADDISCGSNSQIVIGSFIEFNSNIYKTIYKYNTGNGTFQIISDTPDPNVINNYTRPTVSADGTYWFRAQYFTPFTIKNGSGVTNDFFNWISVYDNNTAVATMGTGNNNVYISNPSNSFTQLPSNYSGSFEKVVIGADGKIWGMLFNPVSGNNVMIYDSNNNTWSFAPPIVATDIAIGDATKVMVVSGGNLYFLHNGQWLQDQTAPANIAKIALAGDGTAFLLTSITNPDIYNDNNIYRNTWSAINPCSVSSNTPVNTTPAQNLTICPGQSTTLNVSGNGSLVWYSNPTTPTSFNVGTSYTTPPLMNSGSYIYYVQSEFSNCNTERIPIEVTVLEQPAITSNPVAMTICEGEDLVFNASASGDNLQYQWNLDGNPISGANASSLTIPNATTSNTGNYHLTASNTCNQAFSNSVLGTVNPFSIEITAQPTDVNACSGENATLNVSATGNINNIQWYQNGSPVSGANSLNYAISNISGANGGTYFVELSTLEGCVLNSNNITINTGGLSNKYPLDDGISDDIQGTNNAVKVGNWSNGTNRFSQNDKAFVSTHWNGNVLDIADIQQTEASVSMFVKRTEAIGGYTTLIASDVDNAGQVHLLINNATNRIGVYNNFFYQTQTPQGEIPTNSIWYHVVWTASGSHNIVYVNGVEVLNRTNGVNPNVTPISRFANTSPTNSNQGLDGSIDEIEVYSSMLSANDVRFIRGFQYYTPHTIGSPCGGNNVSVGPLGFFHSGITGTITYQWFKDGVAVPGQTSNVLSIPNSTAADNGEYYLEAYLGCLKVRSHEPVTINHGNNSLPVITSQPQDATFCNGSPFEMGAGVSGNNLSYLWINTNTGISSSDSLYSSVINSMFFEGTWNFQVSNVCGTVVSNDFTVTVVPNNLSVVSQSSSAGICDGDAVTLNATFNEANLDYQWSLNGSEIIGATTNTYQINTFNSTDVGSYELSATNSFGCYVEITPIELTLSGMPHYYPIENANSDDFIGANHITNTGFTTESDRFGHALGALKSELSNGRVLNISDVSNDQVSVSMWVKRTNTTSSFTTLMASDITTNPVHLLINNSTNRIGIYTDNFYGATTNNGQINTNNQWYHIVWVGNQNNNQIYVDGNLVFNTTNGINPSTVPVSRFGNNSNINVQQGLIGAIDDIKVFSSALTQQEINFLKGFEQHDNEVTLACSGTSLSLNLNLYNPTGANYQWYKDGNPIAGATSSNFFVGTATASDAGAYQLEANLGCVKVYSKIITVDVQGGVAPTINSITPNSIVCENESHTLNVDVTGTATGFQWYLEGNPISGANSANYVINNVNSSNIGSYTVEITSSCGSSLSNPSLLDIGNSYSLNVNEVICAGTSFDFNGVTYNQTGSYPATLQTINGCDSIVTLNLQVLNEIENQISASICDGQTFTFGSQTLSASGTYTETYTSVQNCDSLVILDLVVIDASTIFNSSANICFGDSFTFGSQTLNQTGTYQETFTSQGGCDSIVELTLNVEGEINPLIIINNDVLSTNVANANSYQWIDCNNSNAPVSGANNQNFEPTISGDYAVEVTIGNCTETSDCKNITISGVGIEANHNNEIHIYPNPANDFVNIHNVDNGTRIIISNALGQMTHSFIADERNISLNIESLENGVYLVRFENEDTIITTKKLVVNN